MTSRRLGRGGPLGLLALVLAGALTASACGGASSASPSAPSQSFGIVQDRPVPDVPLVDQSGRPTSLAAFQGKFVVLANFLSLCQDECPMVTGAFISMQRDVQAAGLGDRVVFLEVSVDPGRDTPARLAAYSQQFGATWPLLTAADSAQYTTVNNWATSFSTTRYLKFTFPGYVPTGVVVTSATFSVLYSAAC